MCYGALTDGHVVRVRGFPPLANGSKLEVAAIRMSADNSEPMGITWLERLWERESDNGGLVAANT